MTTTSEIQNAIQQLEKNECEWAHEHYNYLRILWRGAGKELIRWKTSALLCHSTQDESRRCRDTRQRSTSEVPHFVAGFTTLAVRFIHVPHGASSALLRAVRLMVRHFRLQFHSAFFLKLPKSLLSSITTFID